MDSLVNRDASELPFLSGQKCCIWKFPMAGQVCCRAFLRTLVGYQQRDYCQYTSNSGHLSIGTHGRRLASIAHARTIVWPTLASRPQELWFDPIEVSPTVRMQQQSNLLAGEWAAISFFAGGPGSLSGPRNPRCILPS
jgi:hypothetical protein